MSQRGRSSWYVGSLTSVPNKVEQKKKLAYPFLWNSKSEALKRESLLNTFGDGSVNIVYIIELKYNLYSSKNVLQLIKEHRAKWSHSSELAGYTP